MFEYLLHSVSQFPVPALYAVLLVIPFVENVFPPSPSDIIIVIIGALIPAGTVAFVPALLLCAIGSEAGFLFLYYLGKKTHGHIEGKKGLKFLSGDLMKTTREWFHKYGFTIILLNRFISGIRSVISFFAGVSHLPFSKTLVLSSISALIWHAVLLLLGYFFGSYVTQIDYYLKVYGEIIGILCAVGAALFLYRYLKHKKTIAVSEDEPNSTPPEE